MLRLPRRRQGALGLIRHLGVQGGATAGDGTEDGHGLDQQGDLLGIEIGVYGVPETFVIDKEGIIRYKHVGPLTPAALEQKLLPLIKELS